MIELITLKMLGALQALPRLTQIQDKNQYRKACSKQKYRTVKKKRQKGGYRKPNSQRTKNGMT